MYHHPLQKKRILVTVISDLATDYRVHRVCQTLHEDGYIVVLAGTRRKGSLILKSRDYQVHRFKMFFGRSILFYAEFNLRLFFWLLFQKADIFLGNDLDVMPATALAARISRKPLVYDSHEYFLGMEGMDRKPLRRSIWKGVEKMLFPGLKYSYTVCDSIRNLYRRDYDKKMAVVRNLPYKTSQSTELTEEEKQWISSIDQRIPSGRKILLLQGAGLNHQRGAEELVYAMLFLDAGRFHLLIIGGGDVYGRLEGIIRENRLEEKITLLPKIPFAVLGHFTKQAHLGLSIDKPAVINHRYSLPNKLFEYLHAGVPVLASRLVEQERIINHYQVGHFIENHQPEHIAQTITDIFDDPLRWELWKTNTRLVREELNWENESKIITVIFKQVEKDSVSY
jgi:glycosyltransferase involved in cell wall biosynthesis